jgi:hypothetical protein
MLHPDVLKFEGDTIRRVSGRDSQIQKKGKTVYFSDSNHCYFYVKLSAAV